MDISSIIPHIEALIFTSEKPLATADLVELVNNALGFIEDRASIEQVESAMEAIVEKYSTEFYPFEVRQSGGGWQFLTKKEYHKTVAQLNGEKFLKRLSTAALETLAIVAYKQPVTKGDIESIRGVNCDYAVQKLLEKELIVITGRKENAPGQPLVYATSKSFMDYFGINSVDDLPKLKDILASDIVTPTEVGNAHPADEDVAVSENNRLVVNESGDIEELEEPELTGIKEHGVSEAPADITITASEEMTDETGVIKAASIAEGGELNGPNGESKLKPEDKREEEKQSNDATEGETGEATS